MISKKITKMYPDMKIIFITAYKDYAVDAFEIKAFDYLLKPYSESRIKSLLKSLVNIKSEVTTSIRNNHVDLVCKFGCPAAHCFGSGICVPR